MYYMLDTIRFFSSLNDDKKDNVHLFFE